MKLTPQEMKFLKDHRKDFLANDSEAVANAAVGIISENRLQAILKELMPQFNFKGLANKPIPAVSTPNAVQQPAVQKPAGEPDWITPIDIRIPNEDDCNLCKVKPFADYSKRYKNFWTTVKHRDGRPCYCDDRSGHLTPEFDSHAMHTIAAIVELKQEKSSTGYPKFVEGEILFGIDSTEWIVYHMYEDSVLLLECGRPGNTDYYASWASDKDDARKIWDIPFEQTGVHAQFQRLYMNTPYKELRIRNNSSISDLHSGPTFDKIPSAPLTQNEYNNKEFNDNTQFYIDLASHFKMKPTLWPRNEAFTSICHRDKMAYSNSFAYGSECTPDKEAKKLSRAKPIFFNNIWHLNDYPDLLLVSLPGYHFITTRKAYYRDLDQI